VRLHDFQIVDLFEKNKVNSEEIQVFACQSTLPVPTYKVFKVHSASPLIKHCQ
jgi:hypothetical protein